jgi:hypothetical protein
VAVDFFVLERKPLRLYLRHANGSTTRGNRRVTREIALALKQW